MPQDSPETEDVAEAFGASFNKRMGNESILDSEVSVSEMNDLMILEGLGESMTPTLRASNETTRKTSFC